MLATAFVDKPSSILKLNLGCGKQKMDGFTGVDSIAFEGVDVVCDLGSETWPWDNDSVDQAHSSHFIEHLTNFNDKFERVHFFNELFRVMKPMGKCFLVFPHWSSNRFFGDPTHKEPIAEMSFFYLDRLWRSQNAPHTDIQYNPKGYSCNWNCEWGYSITPELAIRHSDYQTFAMKHYRDVILDMQVTMTATKEWPK
jgi:hypothetical protein